MSTTHTFTVTGMHCASCGLRIDDAIEDLPGVRRSTTSARTGRTVVEHDGLDPQDLAAAITAAGYGAELVC
ncbi:heavy-metal-associated domain-containing protein [Dactylosporangium sp. NPDC000521]|uniref:heavy-metal-associated domain-containing protein n=1 Tax=Dactylosporangium sp. NPDC000521 TaxID=3363975 RepID=UPI00367AE338